MSILRSSRPARSAAASFVLAAGIVVAAAQPASAQVVLVVVPPGCGSISGTLVDADKLDDHSGDAGPIGTALAPYVADLKFGMITIGTAFDDHIRGNNGVDDTICGLAGGDRLYGWGGDDHIFGGNGADVIEGDSGADDLHGGGGIDAIYGDNAANSNGGLDGADTIFGGDRSDTLRGGAGADVIHGGGTGGPADPDVDFAEGQVGGASCTGVEDIDPTATVTASGNPGPC
jgi:Ca2+-binding RTX toxin-like protein